MTLFCIGSTVWFAVSGVKNPPKTLTYRMGSRLRLQRQICSKETEEDKIESNLVSTKSNEDTQSTDNIEAL